jgi:hypothetical protein
LSAIYQAVGIESGTIIPTKILTHELKSIVIDSFPRPKKRKAKYLKDDSFLMIISQDCDLNKPNSAFPVIEVLVGRPIPKVSENLTRAKSVKKLIANHNSLGLLEFENEFTALIEKSDFEVFLLSNARNLIASERGFTRFVLEWKILGYCREPFPDRVNHMVKGYLNDDPDKKLLNLLQDGNKVHKLMAYVDPNAEAATHYHAYFTLLLYDIPEEEKEEIRQQFSIILNELSTLNCGVTIGNSGADITHPNAVIEDDIPFDQVVTPFDIQLGDFLKLREVNLEYLSYKNEEGDRIDEE